MNTKRERKNLIKTSVLNKSLFIIVFFIFKLFPLYGQEQAYTKALIEKFTDIALQYNPTIKSFKDQAEISHYLIRVKKFSWLNQIVLTGNLNEYNLNPPPLTSSTGFGLYPKYNFGITIPLGIFFTRPKEIRQARIQFDEDLDVLTQEKANIRIKISDKVQEFILQREQSIIMEGITEQFKINFMNKEKAFRSGTTSLADYTEAKHSYYTALSNSLKTKRDLMVAQYDLELLIGRPLGNNLNM